MRSAAAAAVAAFVLGIAAFGVFTVRPWLTQKRDFPAAVPNPPPLDVTDLDELGPHQHMCMRDIAADPHGNQARFKVGTFHRPGPPLLLTIRGAGYSVAAPVAAGFEDNATLQVPIKPPPRAELVTICIRNDGRKHITLYSASGRSRSRALVYIQGKRVLPAPNFAFYEAKPVSIGDRIATTVDRIATFRGPFSHAWVIWALVVLLVAGVPLAVGAALWIAYGRTGSES